MEKWCFWSSKWLPAFFVLNFIVRNCSNFTLLWDYIFFYFLVLRWYCIKWMWCYWAVCFSLTSSFYITLKLPNITEFPKSLNQASFNVNILHGMVLWSAPYIGVSWKCGWFLKKIAYGKIHSLWCLFLWVLTNTLLVTKSCLTLCDPMDCSMSGFTVLHYLPESDQTHVHWVSDAI